MGTLAIRPMIRSRKASQARSLEVVRPVEEVPARQDRDESPLLHANAAQALVLAASPIARDHDGRRVVAVVMDDGSVVSAGAEAGSGTRWASGQVSGSDWTMWWQRRKLGAAR